jgi:2-haloacid dehalogenase
MINTIVFDFGAVLVDWNPHRLFDPYFGSKEKADWFLTHVCNMEWNVQMDAGKPFAQGIAELQARFPEWSKEIQMYFDRWIDMMEELVLELKGRGYRVLGLTNWSMETFCQVRHSYRVFDLMDGMLVSGEEHLIKPDPAFFQLLLDRFSLRAGECVFIDDNPDNVAAAIGMGMQGIRFQDAGQTRKELKKLIP